MKNGLSKVKGFGIKARALVCSGILAAQTGLMNTLTLSAFGTTTDNWSNGNSINENADAVVIIKKVIGIFLSLVAVAGGVFAVVGLYKFIMSFKNDQPEAQASAVKEIIVGVALIAFRLLWNVLGNVIFGKAS